MNKVKLSSLVFFIRGITFKPNDVVAFGTNDSVACMRTKNVQSDLDESDIISVPSVFVKRNDLFLQEGDLLISTANSWNLVGKCSYVPKLSYTATAGGFIAILRPREDNLDRRFFYHWLASPRTQYKARLCGRQTTNISNLDRERFLDLEIPLPPLPEQKRIAAILDKADEIRRKRQQALKFADEFLRSVFLDMFGDPVTNPKGWDKESISDLATRVTKGESPKWQGFQYQDEGVFFVTSENVLWGTMNKQKRKYISEEFHKKLRRSQLKENDLLINLVGASIGRSCLVTKDILPANINQAVSVTSLNNEKIIPMIALQQVITPQLQRDLLGNAVDFARANLSLTNIRELKLIVPPLDMQLKWYTISNRVQAFLNKENTALLTITSLFNSLSQRAFQDDL